MWKLCNVYLQVLALYVVHDFELSNNMRSLMLPALVNNTRSIRHCLEMENVLPVLFLDDDGGPLQFSIRGVSPECKLTSYLIKLGGGNIHLKRDGPNTIVLDNPESRILGENECFGCQYIYDCCEANCLLDLNKYRLNKHSKYVKDYDANLILLKKKSWKDVPLESANDSSGEEANPVEFTDEDVWSSYKSGNLKTLARPYRESERTEIINWIIKNRGYSSVGGNALWMQMEEEEVCEGRSWQSLKEHFKKKIMPNIKTFGLSKKHINCFEKRRSYCN